MIETEMIDKMYLELSQFTRAFSQDELDLIGAVRLLNSMVLSGESHSSGSSAIVGTALRKWREYNKENTIGRM